MNKKKYIKKKKNYNWFSNPESSKKFLFFFDKFFFFQLNFLPILKIESTWTFFLFSVRERGVVNNQYLYSQKQIKNNYLHWLHWKPIQTMATMWSYRIF